MIQPKVLLIALILFFLLTRFYQITAIPASVYWDEASIGYNAYSILSTGRDEWGKFLPVHFRAFGEFKLPVYIYATVLSVKLFGLNTLAVRLPAVLFSLGVIILTYFLTKKLTGDQTVGLLSSFFVSVSPWFFIFSRTGYEATAGLLFYLGGIYLLLEYQRNRWSILFSVVAFILSYYSYNSFRVIAPISFIFLFFVLPIHKINLRKNLLPLFLSSVFIVVSASPIYRLYKYDAGGYRLQMVSATPSTIISNYFLHFSPNFLLITGDRNSRSQIPDSGQIDLFQAALLLLGLIYIIGRKSKLIALPLVLLLLAPLPAAITKESPHALRSISAVPFIGIVSAFGVIFLSQIVKFRYLTILMVTLSLFSFINYFFKFITVYPIQSSKDWQYGYQKIYTNFQSEFPQYERIFISDEYAQPYIFALFYQKVDPNYFRETVVRNSPDQWSFSTVKSFSKLEFGKIKVMMQKKPQNELIFATDKEKLSGIVPYTSVKFLDGSIAFWVYKL